VGNLRVRDHLEDPGVDACIILKWLFKKWEDSMDWIDLAQNWDRADSCECGIKPSGSIK
jgi:hypothetical protein